MIGFISHLPRNHVIPRHIVTSVGKRFGVPMFQCTTYSLHDEGQIFPMAMDQALHAEFLALARRFVDAGPFVIEAKISLLATLTRVITRGHAESAPNGRAR